MGRFVALAWTVVEMTEGKSPVGEEPVMEVDVNPEQPTPRTARRRAEKARRNLLMSIKTVMDLACRLLIRRSYIVNLIVFPSKVTHVRCRVDFRAGYSLDELLGLKLVAMTVDILA